MGFLRLIWHMPRSTPPTPLLQPSRVTLGSAIALALQHSSVQTQEALAELLSVDQTTVSKMIRGKTAVTVERVAKIEDLCDLPRGWILWTAGFVEPQRLNEVSMRVEHVIDQTAIAEGTVLTLEEARPARRGRTAVLPRAAAGADETKQRVRKRTPAPRGVPLQPDDR
jgi:transcriptional regulator with XRE-family HTH domain